MSPLPAGVLIQTTAVVLVSAGELDPELVDRQRDAVPCDRGNGSGDGAISCCGRFTAPGAAPEAALHLDFALYDVDQQDLRWRVVADACGAGDGVTEDRPQRHEVRRRVAQKREGLDAAWRRRSRPRSRRSSPTLTWSPDMNGSGNSGRTPARRFSNVSLNANPATTEMMLKMASTSATLTDGNASVSEKRHPMSTTATRNRPLNTRV